jgi:hypothetical protein
MAASREVEQWDRFNGGLNLTKQTSSLSPDETPDCLNMDFGLRGGFMLRGGFRTQATDSLLNNARIIGVAEVATPQLLIHSTAGDLLKWDGSSLSDTTFQVSDASERVRMANFNDKAYLANGRLSGNIIMQTWDGTTRATLGTAWNNDYLAPTTGNMPLARHIASHAGFMFVADTVESTVRKPTRVRFSHEQFPESWAEADYFDVGAPGVNDPITALYSFADKLVIFKKSSVWAVYGYDRDTFLLEQIADATGICTCGAGAVNAGVLYWYATDGHLMAYNGRNKPFVLSEKIDWWGELGKIKHGGAHRLMWSDGRLYLSLEAGSGEPVGRWLFVYDPTSKSFTRYDRVVQELIHWSKIGADGDPLFLEKDSTHLFRYDRQYESDLVGAVETRIDGYYRTAWMKAGETATRKRWKRPRVTAAGNADATINVEVFLDFDDLTPRRSSEFRIETPDDVSLWGAMDWGDTWFARADDYYEFERIGSAGTGFASSFKFSSPDNVGRWWVDSIAVPFRRKQVR